MRPFTPRTFWAHERFMDVKVLVLKVSFVGPDYVKAKIEWWNARGKFLGIKQNIKVLKKDYGAWKFAGSQA